MCDELEGKRKNREERRGEREKNKASWTKGLYAGGPIVPARDMNRY